MLDAEIKFATCKIECGKETGTGFLVAPDKVLTARHCILNAIDENTPITLSFKFTECSEEIKATIIDHNEDLDICLLLLEKTSKFTPISLSETLPIGGSGFYAYGWPVEKLTIGHRLEGTISQVLDTPKLGMDVEIQIDTPTVLTNYEGFSGSALISDGSCLGIMRVAVGNTIGVISIAQMGEFLLKHKIVSEYISGEKQDLEPLASQEKFTQKFDTFVTDQSGGYIFIEGAHGIGKSTFCTTYTPLDPSLEHFDTYSFTSKRNTVNAVQLAQPQEFVNWLNMQVSMFITQQPGRITKNDYPTLIKETVILLTRLGQEYISHGKIGVLFIDGIDEIAKHDEELLNRFIGLLPQQVPTGLAFVISAPTYATFSTRLGARLKPDICLSMPLLTNNVTQDFCKHALLENRSNPSTIKLISDKAQGHPLYLRYLIDLVNSGANDNELATLPLIDGSIRNYYNALWDQLQIDAEAVNLLAIVVRLRWGISIQQFTEILNQAEQAVLLTTINRIKHLFLTPNETTIYHSSFSEFLVEKTQLRNPDIQRRLAEYCENHGDNHYGLLNVIYHGLKSEGIAIDHIVSLCDQKWVDNCVTEGVEPDVLLGDVHEVLKATTQRGNLVETVRILLLSQRIQFRYNILFAQSASLIANALISLGKTQEALKHVIRYGRLIISTPEALKIALKLIETNSYQDALELLSIIETLIDEQLDLVKNSKGISFLQFLKLYDLQLQQFCLKERADDQSTYLDLIKFNFYWMKNVDDSSPNKEANKLIRSEMITYMQAARMCLSGRYMTISQIRQCYSGPLNELIEPLIYTTSYYRDLCNCFSISQDKKLLSKVFDDLQTLILDGWDRTKLIHSSTIDSLISLDAE